MPRPLPLALLAFARVGLGLAAMAASLAGLLALLLEVSETARAVLGPARAALPPAWRTPPARATAWLLLVGGSLGGLLGLALLARVERRGAETRRARFLTRGQGEPGGRGTGTPARAETPRTRAPVEAILIVDLVQSTELLVSHGDQVFRELLRRVQALFIPIARRWGSRAVDGHGDGLLFCFDRAEPAYEAVRAMFARIPQLAAGLPPGAEPAFRASLHVGATFVDAHGQRSGVAVLRAIRLGGVMETLYGRGGGRNTLVVSAEALPALQAMGVSARLLGEFELRGFPGTYPVYQVDL